MTHANRDRRKAYWRDAQRRRRQRLREDASGELQRELREAASAAMNCRGALVTCRWSADDVKMRADLPEGSDLSAVRHVWVPEVPAVRIHDAMDRLCSRHRQVTMLALVPALSAPQDWPTLLAAVEAADLSVLVRRWIRQRPAIVLGFGVDPSAFSAAWRPWGVVLHGRVLKPVAVQHEPPPSPPRREPASSAGPKAQWQAPAPPDAEDVPTAERVVPPPAEEDEVDRIHRRVFGTGFDALTDEQARKRVEEIETCVFNRERVDGLTGTAAEDRAVRVLKTRYKIPD